jgi:hypothetical protein
LAACRGPAPPTLPAEFALSARPHQLIGAWVWAYSDCNPWGVTGTVREAADRLGYERRLVLRADSTFSEFQDTVLKAGGSFYLGRADSLLGDTANPRKPGWEHRYVLGLYRPRKYFTVGFEGPDTLILHTDEEMSHGWCRTAWIRGPGTA